MDLTAIHRTPLDHPGFRRARRGNNERLAHGEQPVSLPAFVTSSQFVVDVAEKYLQFFLFIVARVWLIQRGSPESKSPGEIGGETDERQREGRHTTAQSKPVGAPHVATDESG